MERYETVKSKNGKYLLDIRYDYDAETPRAWDNLGTIYGYWKGTCGIIDEEAIGGYNSFEEEFENEVGKFEDYIYLNVYGYDHGGRAVSTSSFGCPWDSGQIGYIYVSKKDILAEFGGKRVGKKLREMIEEVLKKEIEDLNRWLQNDVYGYFLYEINEKELKNQITDELYDFDEEFETLSKEEQNKIVEEVYLERLQELDDEEFIEMSEEIDSCWGFYGEEHIYNSLPDDFEV